MSKGKFVPVYKILFFVTDINGSKVLRNSFFVDYFCRDITGRHMFDLLADYWCAPYGKSFIEFERLPL